MSVRSKFRDPADVREALLQGVAEIERGNFIELKGEAELKEFFDDVVSRGKKRSADRKENSPG